MCGIVGYLGYREAYPILIKGLHRLEYRGYDSAGVALLSEEGKLNIYKAVGKVSNLEQLAEGQDCGGTVGIAHTRWATHGAPNQANAHPHLSQSGDLTMVHNGMIENAATLREQLRMRGFSFRSDTDTEVLLQLIEYCRLKHGLDLAESVRTALKKVIGAYAIAVIDKHSPDQIIAARKSSPLAVGIGEDNCEFFIASDASPIAGYTNRVVYIQDEEVAICRRGEPLKITTLNADQVDVRAKEIDLDVSMLDKGGFPHFMLKEIFDQPQCLRDCMRGRVLPAHKRIVLSAVTEQDADGFYRPASNERVNERRAAARIRRAAVNSQRRKTPAAGLATGEKHFLVILVQFSDVQFTNSKQSFEKLLNQVGYSANDATGSARDYYYENSGGDFTPVFDVYGPVTLDNNRAYYGGNDTGGYDLHPANAVKEGCQKVNAYACTNELSTYLGSNNSVLTEMCGIGTACHEFGHAMGLPDMYDTDYGDDDQEDPVDPEAGMIVYHADKSDRNISLVAYGTSATAQSLWENWTTYNSINANGSHPCFYIVPAADQTSLQYGDSKFAFPGSSNSWTTFTAKSWNGVDSDVVLSNISYASSSGTVTFTATLPTPQALISEAIAFTGGGTVTAGTAFPLDITSSIPDYIDHVDWYLDDEPVSGSSVIIPAGNHVLEARIHYVGGGLKIVEVELRGQ